MNKIDYGLEVYILRATQQLFKNRVLSWGRSMRILKQIYDKRKARFTAE